MKFSDGIFETILIKENRAILLKEHLNRLKRTAKILNIEFQLDEKFIMKIINDGIKNRSLLLEFLTCTIIKGKQVANIQPA